MVTINEKDVEHYIVTADYKVNLFKKIRISYHHFNSWWTTEDDEKYWIEDAIRRQGYTPYPTYYESYILKNKDSLKVASNNDEIFREWRNWYTKKYIWEIANRVVKELDQMVGEFDSTKKVSWAKFYELVDVVMKKELISDMNGYIEYTRSIQRWSHNLLHYLYQKINHIKLDPIELYPGHFDFMRR